MALRRNPVVRWLAATITIAFVRLTGWLPLEVSRSVGRFFGRLAYYVLPRGRKVAMANLDLAFGDVLTRAEKVRIVKRAMESVAIGAAEFARIPALRGKLLESQVRWAGFERIDASRGCLVIGAHLGNWEWMAPALHARGCRMAVVVRPLDEPRLNRMVDRTRRAGGVRTLEREGAGREVIRLLREGWVVGVLIDQNPRSSAVPVRFFDQPCWATIAPVMAALRARVPVHAIRMTREPEGTYTFEILPATSMTRTGDLRRDLVENTQRCQDVIEGLIRRYPEQWLWFHRRWKKRTRLEMEWQARLARDRPPG